jgi:hypothetical protein
MTNRELVTRVQLKRRAIGESVGLRQRTAWRIFLYPMMNSEACYFYQIAPMTFQDPIKLEAIIWTNPINLS